MTAFWTWVGSTQVSWFVTHHPWVWPTCEILHFLGMSLLFGCIGLLDARLLGVWTAFPVAGVNALVRWGVAGFVINVLTGLVFFVGDPLQYVSNPGFQLKMLLVVFAGWNVILFYTSGIAGQIESLAEHEEAPVSAKVFAGTSLVLWVGTLFLGRMLPYLRP